MNNPFVIGILSWFLPGSGHLIQKKTISGVLIGGTVWAMFITGLISGGAYYPGFSFQDGQLLYLLNAFATLGNGLGDVIRFLASVEPAPNMAAEATFEYGGRFKEVAGLLNFLAVIDAMDHFYGRKK